MYKTALEDIKKRVLLYNKYFADGYTNVVFDPVKGVADDKQVIFPNDTLGDYFYLRIPQTIGFGATGDDLLMTVPVTLVAVVRKADADKLAHNIIMTLLNTCESVIVTGANVVREGVVRAELGNAYSTDEVNATLQRLSDFTIISVSFTYATELLIKPLSCIVNPCSSC